MSKSLSKRVVITGLGVVAPNGNNLAEFRNALLEGKSGLGFYDIRYMGKQVAGFCHFDESKHQSRKARRRGTRAGAISIYCAREALIDAKVDWSTIDKDRVGVYLGITEHGNVETEEEIYQLHQNEMQPTFWSPHHNPRTVANSPAGEVTLSLEITGPHYTVGAACAGGNAGLIQAVQMIQLGEVDYAFAGGVSESPQTFGIFAGFAAQGALGTHETDASQAITPLSKDRKGIAISEGGAIYFLESLESAQNRGAHIYAEIVGHGMNSDATDYVNPNTERQIQCMQKALKMAGMEPKDINLVSMHATGTPAGDAAEANSIRVLFQNCPNTFVNFTKGHIGHAMGAAGALELAGNLPSLEDGMIHPGMNCHDLDPDCAIDNLVLEKPMKATVETILNNSFGMLGINSVVIVKKFRNGVAND